MPHSMDYMCVHIYKEVITYAIYNILKSRQSYYYYVKLNIETNVLKHCHIMYSILHIAKLNNINNVRNMHITNNINHYSGIIVGSL